MPTHLMSQAGQVLTNTEATETDSKYKTGNLNDTVTSRKIESINKNFHQQKFKTRQLHSVNFKALKLKTQERVRLESLGLADANYRVQNE